MEEKSCLFSVSLLTSYTQELPTRFKKEVAAAALSYEQSDLIAMDGLQRVLHNIGAENRISEGDMKLIFHTIGNEHGEIPVLRFIEIL